MRVYQHVAAPIKFLKELINIITDSQLADFWAPRPKLLVTDN